MLLDSKLPKVFWKEAVYVAAYVSNHCPTKATGNKTPTELFFGHKPDDRKLKVFGCVTYRHIRAEERRKFDSKSEACIFVGYCENGYQLWSPEHSKIINSKNVIFVENKKIVDLKVEGKSEEAIIIKTPETNAEFTKDDDDGIVSVELVEKEKIQEKEEVPKKRKCNKPAYL